MGYYNGKYCIQIRLDKTNFHFGNIATSNVSRPNINWDYTKILPIAYITHTCQVSCLQRESHALTLTPIILTIIQKSTNWKILVKIIKLPKQNWFAQYRNSNQLAVCFNVFLSQLVTFRHSGIEETD